MSLEIIKIFLPTVFAFMIGIFITPIATHFFYKYRLWKKRPRTETTISSEFKEVHKDKEKSEISVPCVGGSIIWVSVTITIFGFYLMSFLNQNDFWQEVNFFSRSQTVLPFGLFILGALVGLVDDILEIMGKSNITRNSKIYTWSKIAMIVFCGVVAGLWFYQKLGMDFVHVPFDGILYLGVFFVPFVVVVMLATFSGSVIDGLDGLAGGVLATIFASYTVIAVTNQQYDLAAFGGVITGAILAFLWFNIPPARFYMGETGMMALTILLATFAFMTDTVLLLPIIAFPLVITSLSNIIQMLSKKFRNGKRVFRVAPLHHHFEAIGWSREKIVMRYWVISLVFAIIGIILHVITK